jgi:SanA protein
MMILRIASVLILILVLVFFIPRLIALLYSLPRTYQPADVPSGRVAIVFGAGLRRDGSPSPVLRDRVATAAGLYFSGKVEKILMSGDNRFIYYNEPGAMRQYALDLGVPDEAIVLDYAGRRTYDTCYRAKAIFQVEEAILVTQQFHLPRALYTCNKLGLPSVGVPADQLDYFSRSRLYWNLREIPATSVALWEIYIAKPIPVLGDPEPIFSKETS